MEIELSAVRGAKVLARDGEPIGRVRDLYLDSLGWRVHELVVDAAQGVVGWPLIVPVAAIEERSAQQASFTLGAPAARLASRFSARHADRRSAAALCGYSVHAKDGELGRVADLVVDDARWIAVAICARGAGAPGAGLRIPVLGVEAIRPIERRIVLRLERSRLLRFACPSAVDA
jgi:sporulation protein YlmC with PRC-barrel domain